MQAHYLNLAKAVRIRNLLGIYRAFKNLAAWLLTHRLLKIWLRDIRRICVLRLGLPVMMPVALQVKLVEAQVWR